MQMLWHWRCTAGTTCIYPLGFLQIREGEIVKIRELVLRLNTSTVCSRQSSTALGKI